MNRVALLFFISLVLGVLFYVSEVSFIVLKIIITLLLVLGIASLVKYKQIAPLVLALGLAFGIILTFGFTKAQTSLSQFETINGKAVVISSPKDESFDSFTARITQIDGKKVNFKVLVKSSNNKSFEINDEITFTDCKIQKIHSVSNPTLFNYENYHKSNKIFYELTLNHTASVVGKGGVFPFKQARELNKFLVERIDSVMPSLNSKAFTRGIFLGDKALMSKDMTNTFKIMGISHILAVSGMHVMIIMMLANIFFSLFGIKGKALNFLSILTLVTFCLVTGLSASVIRASLVSVCLIHSSSGRRDYDTVSALAVMASLMIMFSPYIIYSLSFQLSFSAALGISLIKFKLKPLPKFLSESISLNIASTITTLPILLNSFGAFSIFTLIGNIILIPLIPLFYTLGILCALTGSYKISLVTDVLFDLIYKALQFISSFKYSYLSLPVNALILSGITLFAIFTLIVFSKEVIFKRRTVTIIYTLIAFLIVLGNIVLYIPHNNKLTAEFINVGHGDCCLLTLNQNKRILIDTGPPYYTQSQVVPYLKKKGINKIDLLVLSHNHSDHAGGISIIKDNFKILNVLSPEKAEDLPYIKPYNNMMFSVGNALIKVLNTGNGNSDNSSLVIKVLYGKSSILFTGDTEFYEEALLEDVDCDVLKVAHHGSNSSTYSSFLRKATPSFSVISVDKDNSFGFPKTEVLKRISKTGSKIYRTDISGLIKIDIFKNGIISVKE